MPSTAAERWAKARTFHHSLYPAQRIAAEREQSVSVCLPARECAATVGHIVAVACLDDQIATLNITAIGEPSPKGIEKYCGRCCRAGDNPTNTKARCLSLSCDFRQTGRNERDSQKGAAPHV